MTKMPIKFFVTKGGKRVAAGQDGNGKWHMIKVDAALRYIAEGIAVVVEA